MLSASLLGHEDPFSELSLVSGVVEMRKVLGRYRMKVLSPNRIPGIHLVVSHCTERSLLCHGEQKEGKLYSIIIEFCRALGRAGVGLPPSYTQINTRGGVRRILDPLRLRSQAATSLNSRQFCLGVSTRGGVSRRQRITLLV